MFWNESIIRLISDVIKNSAEAFVSLKNAFKSDVSSSSGFEVNIVISDESLKEILKTFRNNEND